MSTIPAALRAASDTLNDVEALRIATENRHRMLTRSTEDKDGHIRGYGLTKDEPMVALTAATLEALVFQEKALTKQIEKEVKKTPYENWIKRSRGIGAKQAARLLAALGDPYLNEQTGEPRTVSQLWAYSGYGRIQDGVTMRPRKGMSQEELFGLGNPQVKMRLHMIAKSVVKAGPGEGGKYREIYDTERLVQDMKVHSAPCPQCHEKEAGTPLKPGHQHARALRKVAKEVLRDLWIEGKVYYEGKENT